IRSLSGGLDGTDERDSPHTNLRYPFQDDQFKGKIQAPASRSPPGTVLSIQGTTPQNQDDSMEGPMPSQDPDAEPGDVRRGECSNTAFPVCSKLTLRVATSPHAQPGRVPELVEPAMTLEDLIAKWRPPVGREDNSNRVDRVLNETPRAVQP